MNNLVFVLMLFVAEPMAADGQPWRAAGAVISTGSPHGSNCAQSCEIGRYDTATECDHLAKSVKVHHRGARLKCIPWRPPAPQGGEAVAVLP